MSETDPALARALAAVTDLGFTPRRIGASEPRVRGTRRRIETDRGLIHVRSAADQPAAIWHLGLEARALGLLAEADPLIAPHLLYASTEDAMLVTLDVADACGAGGSLMDGLMTNAAAALDVGATRLAMPMARLAALPDAWVQRWRELTLAAGEDPDPAAAEFKRVLDACDRPAALLASAEQTPADLRAWLAPLRTAWSGAPGMTSLSHGDPAPTNNYLGTRGARLLDFEYALPRHRLFDLAQWATRCPLPARAFARMREHHFERVGADAAAPTHRGHLLRELNRTIVVSAAYMLVWLPTDRLLEADQPWVADWTARTALLHALSVIEQAGADAELQQASAFARDLAAALALIWPDVRPAGPDFVGLSA